MQAKQEITEKSGYNIFVTVLMKAINVLFLFRETAVGVSSQESRFIHFRSCR